MKYLAILVIIISAVTASFGQNDKIVEEIKKMDRQWQVESYASRDLKDYDRIVAEDFLITGSNGTTLNKEQKRANVVADFARWDFQN